MLHNMLVYTIYYNHWVKKQGSAQKDKVGNWSLPFWKTSAPAQKTKSPLKKMQTSHMQLLSVCFCLYLLVQEYILQQLNNCRCTLWKRERLSYLFPKKFICTILDFCVESFSFCFSNLRRVLCWKFNTEKK